MPHASQEVFNEGFANDLPWHCALRSWSEAKPLAYINLLYNLPSLQGGPTVGRTTCFLRQTWGCVVGRTTCLANLGVRSLEDHTPEVCSLPCLQGQGGPPVSWIYINARGPEEHPLPTYALARGTKQVISLLYKLNWILSSVARLAQQQDIYLNLQ